MSNQTNIPVDKDNFNEAIKLLTEKLGNTPLAERAAHALAFGWNQGYCDYTESQAVFDLLKPLTCSYCGRLHYCHAHQLKHEEWEKEKSQASVK
jgi:hypothetical protein